MSEEQLTEFQKEFLVPFIAELVNRDIANLSEYLRENGGQMPEGFWLSLHEQFRGQMRVDEIKEFWQDNRESLLPALDTELPIWLKALRYTEKLMEAAFNDEPWAIKELEKNRARIEKQGGYDKVFKNDRIGLVQLDSEAQSKVVDLRARGTVSMLIEKLDRKYGERATDEQEARQVALIDKAIQLSGEKVPWHRDDDE